MANLVFQVLTFALIFFVVSELQIVRAKPALPEEYDAVEVGLEPELPVEDKFDPNVICKLPMKRGNCRALLLRWRYDPTTGECKEFKYGGCAGNANNFNTRKQCVKMCEGV